MSKEQFHELSDYIVEYFVKLEEKLSLSMDLKYVYQADNKQKTLIKITKIADRYSVLLKADLLVSINEDYFDKFDEEAKGILIDQELALIECDLEKGTIKIGRADLITSTGIIKKYGVEAVERANKVRDLYNQQKEDEESGGLLHQKPKSNFKKR